MNLFFPPILPLRTGVTVEAKRPSMVAIYKPNKRGKLVLVRGVLPRRAIK